MAHYLDTSAMAKLVVAERESSALMAWLGAEERDPVTSDLARTELMRLVRRTAPDRALRAREVLDSVTVTTLPTRLFEDAVRLDPPVLRALDAIHLVAALDLGDDLEAIVAYDARLREAAAANGVAVVAPS